MAAREANTGLTFNEANALRLTLKKLEALEPGRAYLGGRERGEFDALLSDIRLRLDPLSPETLAERAEAFMAPLREYDWARTALAETEAA